MDPTSIDAMSLEQEPVGPLEERILPRHATILRTFTRSATPDEKREYSQLRGTTAKKAYREHWLHQRCKNVAAKAEVIEGEVKSDLKEGWYSNIHVMIKNQGGQIDINAATEAAMNVARECTRRGPPYVMWNAWSKRLEFLDIKKGTRDTYNRATTRTLSGDIEMYDDAIQNALADAQKNGLSNAIPDGAVTSFFAESLAPTEPPTPSPSPSPTPPPTPLHEAAAAPPVAESLAMWGTPDRRIASGLATPKGPSHLARALSTDSIEFVPAEKGSIGKFFNKFPSNMDGGHGQHDSTLLTQASRAPAESPLPATSASDPSSGAPSPLPLANTVTKNGRNGNDDNESKRPKRVKTIEEKDFNSCTILGKRFNGLLDKLHELEVFADDDRDFAWAKEQVAAAKTIANAYIDLRTTTSKIINMSNFAKFILQPMRDGVTASEWITKRKHELEGAISIVEDEIMPIVRMQSAKNQVHHKGKAKTKAKGRTSQSASSIKDESATA